MDSIGVPEAALDAVASPQTQKGRARQDSPLAHSDVLGCLAYQVPEVCAEQPPLSAVPVPQVRLVVPLAERDSVNVAAFESRFEVTTTE